MLRPFSKFKKHGLTGRTVFPISSGSQYCPFFITDSTARLSRMNHTCVSKITDNDKSLD